MRVLFRVDASQQIGSGHVIRCLTLAEYLRNEGATATFVCRAHEGHLGKYVQSRGHDVRLLPKPPHHSIDAHAASLDHAQWLGATAAKDAAETIDAIANDAFDWLIVDHYGIDKRWETLVQTRVARTLVIDDLADRQHAADILVDQNIHSCPTTRYRQLVPDHCQTLVGPQYAILRRSFAECRSLRRTEPTTAKSIMLFFGGMDEHNVTQKVLIALKQNLGLLSCVHVHAIIGGGNTHRRSVAAVCGDLRRAGVGATLHVDVQNMAELMRQVDGSVAAGGTNTWERCCLGIPTATIAVANNQVPVAQLLSDARVSDYWGTFNELSDDLLNSKIADFVSALVADSPDIQMLRQNSLALVDGIGGMRVVAAMQTIACESPKARTSNENKQAA